MVPIYPHRQRLGNIVNPAGQIIDGLDIRRTLRDEITPDPVRVAIEDSLLPCELITLSAVETYQTVPMWIGGQLFWREEVEHTVVRTPLPVAPDQLAVHTSVEVIQTIAHVGGRRSDVADPTHARLVQRKRDKMREWPTRQPVLDRRISGGEGVGRGDVHVDKPICCNVDHYSGAGTEVLRRREATAYSSNLSLQSGGRRN